MGNGECTYEELKDNLGQGAKAQDIFPSYCAEKSVERTNSEWRAKLTLLGSYTIQLRARVSAAGACIMKALGAKNGQVERKDQYFDTRQMKDP